MSITGKIKTIDNKIEQNSQTAKISVLLSGKVSKFEFLIDKDVSP